MLEKHVLMPSALKMRMASQACLLGLSCNVMRTLLKTVIAYAISQINTVCAVLDEFGLALGWRDLSVDNNEIHSYLPIAVYTIFLI